MGVEQAEGRRGESGRAREGEAIEKSERETTGYEPFDRCWAPLLDFHEMIGEVSCFCLSFFDCHTIVKLTAQVCVTNL